MTDRFRTATGQTGLSAYVYEACQIANAQRELDARFHRLIDAVRVEEPERFQHETDYMFKPGASKAENFRDYLWESRS